MNYSYRLKIYYQCLNCEDVMVFHFEANSYDIVTKHFLIYYVHYKIVGI